VLFFFFLKKDFKILNHNFTKLLTAFLKIAFSLITF
jgi:hypothetical protein